MLWRNGTQLVQNKVDPFQIPPLRSSEGNITSRLVGSNNFLGRGGRVVADESGAVRTGVTLVDEAVVRKAETGAVEVVELEAVKVGEAVTAAVRRALSRGVAAVSGESAGEVVHLGLGCGLALFARRKYRISERALSHSGPLSKTA